MRIDNIRNLQTSSFRRCLRVTLLLFVIQLFAVNHLNAEDRIKVPILKIKPGTTQRLAVQLLNEEAYAAFQATFYFPAGISPVKTGETKYGVTLSSRKTNHTISANVVSDGGLKVMSYSMGNESYTGNSGDLFYIDIISESTFKGPATIEVKNILFTRSSDRKEIKFADTEGIVDNHSSIRGDADGDGKVTIADAETIVNYLVGNPNNTFVPVAADVDGDGEIIIADAVGVLDIIMNSGGAGAPKMEAPDTQP